MSSTAFGPTVVLPAALPRPAALLMARVPADTMASPVKVLTPFNFQVPASTLVTVLTAVPTMLFKVPPTAPPSVRPYAPVMVPAAVKLMVPASPPILASLPKVTRPG